jgi:hypothetical protein
MFYKLLGYVVWNGAKYYLRSRYGSSQVPKPLLAAAIVGGFALAVLAAKRNGSAD